MVHFASHVEKSGKIILIAVAFCLLWPSTAEAKSDLKAQQARKLITRMAGLELPNSSVRVKSISPTSDGAADVEAEIRATLKFEKDNQGRWRIAEIRTGPDRWAEVDHIARALNTSIPSGECSAPDPPFKNAVDPSVKRARCLVASLLSVELPSDVVRIQEVSPLGIPLASQPSAIVIAWIRVVARIVNDGASGWRVAELRAGNRDWVKLDPLVAALEMEKQKRARMELETIAGALERFRRDRGFYIVADAQAVAMDHLSPRYLSRVIRVDPWQRPYKYQGDRERYTLRSLGPDGKAGTADDIELASRSH